VFPDDAHRPVAPHLGAVTGGRPGAFYPEPSRTARLAGIAGIVGGLMWPITFVELASLAATCTEAGCSSDRGALAIAALSPVCLAVTVLGLELRARRIPGMGDLVGDLTVGTSAALFVLSFLIGSVGFVGPGLLLLLIGSAIFGAVGYRIGARQRMASAVVGIGAAGMLVLLLLGPLAGFGTALETPTILALALVALGWAWLGAHLLLARPLPILVRDSQER